jgi:hypothetical protein
MLINSLCICHILFIHSSCYYLLNIVYSAAVNVSVQIFETLLYLDIYPEMVVLDHMVFGKYPYCFS